MTEQDRQTEQKIRAALEMAEANRPGDRSPKDRYYSIVITDLEKVIAFFREWIGD